MKSRYFVYLVIIIVVIIAVFAMGNSVPAPQNNITVVPAKTVTPTASVAPATKAPVKSPTPVASQTSAARYYNIHVVANGTSIHYSSTTANEIKVSNPPLNSSITTPMTLTGLARGPWFFEATAPVLLTDAKGRILSEGYVTAQNNWMTTELVPFMGVLAFPVQPPNSTGVLVFKASNASGLGTKDRAVEILVKFK